MVRKVPLRTLDIKVHMRFSDIGCRWEVEGTANDVDHLQAAGDFTPAPTSGGGDTPWADVVVAQMIERAWEVCYAEQLKLPFP